MNHKISSFEMLGWTDPEKPDAKKPLKWLGQLTPESVIYPSELMENEELAPGCVFIPEEAMMKKMIETIAKGQDSLSREELYAKFSDFKAPKPQWLIEAENDKWKREQLERKWLREEALQDSLSESQDLSENDDRD